VLFKYKYIGSRKSAKALIAGTAANPREALERNLGIEILSVESIE
jgi:hypothetical protein